MPRNKYEFERNLKSPMNLATFLCLRRFMLNYFSNELISFPNFDQSEYIQEAKV